ncbi:MAG: hypothetical protein Q8L47_02015 [bacterium]|nr:hypothetical protein [bacterium]
MARTTKQIIYGVVYLIILFGIIYLVYISFLKPVPSCFDKKQNQNETGVDCGGECAACIGDTKNISVSLSSIFFAKEPVALVRLSNPNNQVGSKSIIYTVNVLDSGGSILKTFNGETFVYPGDQEKNLVFPLIGIQEARSLRVTLGSPKWIRIEEFSKPNISFASTPKRIENGHIIIEGDITNNETLLFDNIDIGALFYGSSGALVGVSKTAVQTVRAFERRAFTIDFPFGNLDINLDATKFYFDALRP